MTAQTTAAARAGAARDTGLAVDVGPAPDRAAWDALFGEAVTPHPHYGRRAVEAHRAAGLLPGDLRFLTVRHGPRLLALLPFTLRRDLSGLGGRVARPFLTPFVTATGPLVADGPDRAAAAGALAEGLALASGGRAWRWPLLPVDDGAAPDLLAALRARGWEIGTVGSFERPVLDRRASHAAFLDGHPHRKRLRELGRCARRLAESGAVAVVSADDGPDLDALVAAFVDLEARGWKGRAGTAMACRPETAALARALFAGGGGPVRARADALTLEGRPVAINLALVGRGTATLLKCTYDEDLRAQAPGLLLDEAIVRACHETGFADRLDSATLPGSAIENLYRDRAAVSEIVALPPGAGGPSLERRLRLARFEREARAAAKRALRR